MGFLQPRETRGSPDLTLKTLMICALAILNGRAGISPEMAIRLSIAFDTTAESWLNQQAQHDLWQVEQHRGELRVKRLTAD
jgi:plasmid maintenance system antidote protein VapI